MRLHAELPLIALLSGASRGRVHRCRSWSNSEQRSAWHRPPSLSSRASPWRPLLVCAALSTAPVRHSAPPDSSRRGTRVSAASGPSAQISSRAQAHFHLLHAVTVSHWVSTAEVAQTIQSLWQDHSECSASWQTASGPTNSPRSVGPGVVHMPREDENLILKSSRLDFRLNFDRYFVFSGSDST